MKKTGFFTALLFLPTLLHAQRFNKDIASTTRIYNEEGRVQMTIAYNPGCSCKTYTEFYRDGKVLAKRFFKVEDNKEIVDGEDITYFRDGSIKIYRNWKDALPEERFYFNYEGGSLEHEEFYDGKYKAGTWKYYDELGNLLREQIYAPHTTLWNSKKDNAEYRYYGSGKLIRTTKVNNGSKPLNEKKQSATKEKPIAATDGKALFALRCQACHAAEKNGYGPAVSQFNKKNSSTWMYNFIKDAQTLIDAGDETAIQLYKQWGNKKHPAQDRLNEEQIRAIVQYLKR